MKKSSGILFFLCLLTAVLLLALAPLQADAAGGYDGQFVDESNYWDVDYNTDGGANWVLRGYRDTGANQVIIPKTVTADGEKLPVRILNGTFRGDTGLKSVNAAIRGVQLTKIMDRTFQDCSSLESLTLPHSLKQIEGSNVFTGVDLSKLTITYVGSLEEYRSISGALLPPAIKSLITAEDGAWSENEDGLISIDTATEWTALTINYVYEDGSLAAAPCTVWGYKGQYYEVKSPDIEGFTPMLDSETHAYYLYGYKTDCNESKTVTYYESSYMVGCEADPLEGGTVSGGGVYKHGSSVTLTAIPNYGYEFVSWELGDGTVVSTDAAYTFTVTHDYSLYAVFVKKSYEIKVSADPADGGRVSGDGTYTYGTWITLTAEANEGYVMDRWKENGYTVLLGPKYVFQVTGPRSLVASFVRKSYEVTASVDPADGGRVSGGGTYTHGSSATLTAEPNEGYEFVGWKENGSTVSTDATYTFEVNGPRSLIASFEKQSAPVHTHISETVITRESDKSVNDVATAETVLKQIAEIPDISSISLMDKESIQSAAKAYDSLPEAQKKLVPAETVKKLVNAKKLLSEMEAEAAAEEKAGHKTVEATGKALAALSDNADPANSDYATLALKTKKITNKSIKLQWNKVKGASGYIIYANKCGKANKYQQVVDVKGASKKSYSLKKLQNETLKKNTYYKIIVAAYKVTRGGEQRVIATSKSIHVATTGGKNGNPAKLTLNKKNVTVKVKKTFKLKAAQKAKAGTKIKKHRKLQFESSDPKIATVSKKGVIKGKKKGKCTIYVFAQNGLSVKVKVTVKK